jgi:biotin operon repressor
MKRKLSQASRILKVLNSGKAVSTRAIASRLGLTQQDVARRISDLRLNHVIITRSLARDARMKTYQLTA